MIFISWESNFFRNKSLVTDDIVQENGKSVCKLSRANVGTVVETKWIIEIDEKLMKKPWKIFGILLLLNPWKLK